MGSLSEEELLRFLAAEGGKAKNSELLSRYREFISHGDPQLRAQHRETFKDIINKVAVVKQEAGEKYVILKKKYQSLITSVENTAKHGTSVDAVMPDHPEGMVLMENQLASTVPKLIVSMLEEGSCEGPDGEASRNSSGSVLHTPEIHVTDCSVSQVDSTAQDEMEPDASEDGGSSGGSAAIALDPIEKEWLQGAASGNVPTLSHLLKQEPSLAGKKDFTSFTALHWAAKHGKKDMTVLLLKAGADVNIRAHVSSTTPLYTRLDCPSYGLPCQGSASSALKKKPRK
ncbi:ankyrin repeat domain-containing protein SOWAHA isoform X5 [Microcaecilia unicolor]|uniref:Ankyrin repeat domain-containing protein SOWAHA-like isoform X5 n=1 Tax=Microcaecilia unicolor TaxID=1415580 RepID=A0A6P7YVD9_9AMPH|nr:ankyrin repeat domain-containing protein SOWAHA-like isoform X5 [Microcaecilia unicolor]